MKVTHITKKSAWGLYIEMVMRANIQTYDYSYITILEITPKPYTIFEENLFVFEIIL